MGAHYNTVNDFAESTTVFVALQETRQLAQPNKLETTNTHVITKRAPTNHKIGPPLNSLFL